jgi:hypothetical protein
MDDYNVQRTIWDYLKAIPDMDKFMRIPIPRTEHHQNLKAMYRSVPDLYFEHFTRDNEGFSVRKLGSQMYNEFKCWCQQNGYVFETNAGKLILALKTLNIACPDTKEKAIGEGKHTRDGESRVYNLSILRTHYMVGCQIALPQKK